MIILIFRGVDSFMISRTSFECSSRSAQQIVRHEYERISETDADILLLVSLAEIVHHIFSAALPLLSHTSRAVLVIQIKFFCILFVHGYHLLYTSGFLLLLVE